ncbi:ABC transporter permease [Collimonas sp.]|jgi:osmoprotectant transport system permease protein|uniref:ABC transporter permease n=1 Tax=Collimonas sp. TaxID=1963772 RepID=UPI002BF55A70|nr:ABC transporter permease [Collimonas sp.]HWW07735.1 ABC transporter permease [Collimonas sp.]
MSVARQAQPAWRVGNLASPLIKLYNPLHLLLAMLAIIAGASLPLLSFAPNRLLSGQGIFLAQLIVQLNARYWLLAIPALPLLVAPWLRPSRINHSILIIAAAALSTGLLALAGHEAQLRSGATESLARVSFGAAFWLLLLTIWLQLAEALRGLALRLPAQVVVIVLALAPAAVLLMTGRLDSLSLLKEFQNHQEAFELALLRHLQLVTFSVLPAVLIGALFGVLSFRSQTARKLLFPVLNVIQTIPSIALFSLLIAPLALLGSLLPHTGISGIGLPPALLALTLYSLLPMSHGTLAALEQVPAAVREAAQGIGMSPWQIFFHVELPLALPVFLSSIRVTTVQAIGLAVVAALIGAGGFGVLMFQGMSSSALDLVLLAVIPVILLAISIDTAFKLAISILERRAGRQDHD